ncbi:MAG TPA: hypothetical protein VII84_08005, partial [Acidimicrobiales bacterium]
PANMSAFGRQFNCSRQAATKVYMKGLTKLEHTVGHKIDVAGFKRVGASWPARQPDGPEPGFTRKQVDAEAALYAALTGEPYADPADVEQYEGSHELTGEIYHERKDGTMLGVLRPGEHGEPTADEQEDADAEVDGEDDEAGDDDEEGCTFSKG